MNENYGCHFIGNKATLFPSWRPKWPLEWQSSFKKHPRGGKNTLSAFSVTFHIIGNILTISCRLLERCNFLRVIQNGRCKLH